MNTESYTIKQINYCWKACVTNVCKYLWNTQWIATFRSWLMAWNVLVGKSGERSELSVMDSWQQSERRSVDLRKTRFDLPIRSFVLKYKIWFSVYLSYFGPVERIAWIRQSYQCYIVVYIHQVCDDIILVHKFFRWYSVFISDQVVHNVVWQFKHFL